jgi:aspartyl-tRNA(Asn)/glutamyl-tRNA(Gln) amidotransferase subunit A
MDAGDTVTAVARDDSPASGLIQRALDRIAAVEVTLNAYTHLDPERSMAAARSVDERVDAGEPLPLAGVAVGVKDLIDHAGWPNTLGASFPPKTPTITAPCIQALEQAGAVVAGRTGLHEFAFGFSSENHWHGPVHNPWDPSLSPGGSSGGSAAAVAAGTVPIALGTDTGGSVRVPAALCGIVGLKVTHGRGSIRGVFPLVASIDTVGPLARTVADAAAAYEVIAEHDPADVWSVPVDVDRSEGAADIGSLTVGIPHPLVDQPVTDPVATGFEWAIERLAERGATVVHLDEPALEVPGKLLDAMYFEAAEVHRERFSQAPDRYGPEVRERLEIAMSHTGARYVAGLAWRARIANAFRRALARCDVLVTPTVAALRKPIGVPEIDVAGSTVPYRGPLSAFTSVINHAGLPAIALPLDRDGAPPPSIQVVGPAWSEARLLDIGLGLEQAGVVKARKPPVWAE